MALARAVAARLNEALFGGQSTPSPLEEVGSRVDLTLSARAFPDSPIAGECHRLRAAILARQGHPEEAERERLRSVEHYVGGAGLTK